MKKISTWIIAGIFFLGSCTNNAENNTVNENPVVPVSEAVEEGKNLDLQQSFPSLVQHLQKQDSSFSTTKFTEGESSPITDVQPQTMEESLKAFAPYFIYNKDSSLAIDLYSYNYILRKKEGQKTLEAAGPDTEVAIIDFKKNTRQRVLFAGPSTIILDAAWTSADELMITGAETIEDEKIKPLLWKINLAQKNKQLFSYPDTVKAAAYSYVEEKLDYRED